MKMLKKWRWLFIILFVILGRVLWVFGNHVYDDIIDIKYKNYNSLFHTPQSEHYEIVLLEYDELKRIQATDWHDLENNASSQRIYFDISNKLFFITSNFGKIENSRHGRVIDEQGNTVLLYITKDNEHGYESIFLSQFLKYCSNKMHKKFSKDSLLLLRRRTGSEERYGILNGFWDDSFKTEEFIFETHNKEISIKDIVSIKDIGRIQDYRKTPRRELSYIPNIRWHLSIGGNGNTGPDFYFTGFYKLKFKEEDIPIRISDLRYYSFLGIIDSMLPLSIYYYPHPKFWNREDNCLKNTNCLFFQRDDYLFVVRPKNQKK